MLKIPETLTRDVEIPLVPLPIKLYGPPIPYLVSRGFVITVLWYIKQNIAVPKDRPTSDCVVYTHPVRADIITVIIQRWYVIRNQRTYLTERSLISKS